MFIDLFKRQSSYPKMCFQGSDSERRFVDKVPALTRRVAQRPAVMLSGKEDS